MTRGEPPSRVNAKPGVGLTGKKKQETRGCCLYGSRPSCLPHFFAALDETGGSVCPTAADPTVRPAAALADRLATGTRRLGGFVLHVLFQRNRVVVLGVV
jgi:hypothetical protein